MRARKIGLLAAIVCALSGSSLSAQQSDVGIVQFANSGSAAAQSSFLRGLAQLHNFEYEDAAAYFRKAQQADPAFAMAYWGEAMTFNHPLWFEQNLDAARAALNRLAPTPEARAAKAGTDRERDYLHAVEILYGDGTKEDRDVRYSLAMAALHQKYPADVDAAAFYALSLMGTCHNGREIPVYMRALAILEDLFYANPNHPGVAHYLIHATDDPVHAPLGLHAARAYSKIAPSAAHAQHMTSHIFIAMGMWDDVVKANETAVAVTNQQGAAKQQPPHMCGHYNFWLEYGYLQQGRIQNARAVLEGCRKSAERTDPSTRSAALDPDNSALGSFAEMRTRYLIDTQDWAGEIAGLKFPDKGGAPARITFDFGTGYAAVRRKELPAARAALKDLQDARRALPPSASGDATFMQRVAILDGELQAIIAEGEGKIAEAVKSVRALAPTETAMPFEFGPPFVELPSYELLGDLLLQSGNPAKARDAFQLALQRTPERTSCLSGLARAETASGNPSAGREIDARLRQIWHAADLNH
ncbi:MAG TPA: tetratricopeptide repeat protein [Candidatus Acidoferrum sp.]|nr:tetratricopeptide repeat protein [Candidatus Acidoferrum sp.]